MSISTILTMANGKGLDLLAPDAMAIDFDVVAEHLAKEARFNGATPGVVYSVAQHCCLGADGILSRGHGATLEGGTYVDAREVAAYFLLHDAHEFSLKDDTTPKKRALAELAALHFGVLAEQIVECFALLTYRHDAAIHQAAGLRWPMPLEVADIVKAWDLAMFRVEWLSFMGDVRHPDPSWLDNLPEFLPGLLVPWKWETARSGYLRRCRDLLPCYQRKRGRR